MTEGPTLIVEDGTIVANANSYITVADALQYFTNKNDEVYMKASAVYQAAALFRAQQGMSFWLNGRWRGRRTNTLYANTNSSPIQSLDWPRCGVCDSDGYRVPNNVIPQRVIQAQCEIAKIEMTTQFIQQKVDKSNSVQSTSVGPISVAYKETAPSIAYWPMVIAMLKDYATIGVMPIEVVIGLSEREMRDRRQDHHGYGLNPFDFPDYFQLVKFGVNGETWDQGGLF